MIGIFARHRVAANLTMIMMTLAGVWAIRSMPSQLDPPANFPMVFVEIQWIGASAEDIETLVTTPIEQQLRTLNELHELTSRTDNGFVSIFVQFNHGTDMTIGLDQVKQRVSSIRNLPPGIEPPIISRFIDLEPIANLLLTGPGEIGELIPLAREMERELMDRGVEGVRYDGLPTEEIALLVGGQRLQELQLTLNDLAREVSRVSQNVPAGTVGSGQGSRQLRSLDQRRDPISFEQLHIQSGDQIIRLGDIADVVRRPQRGQPIVTSNGQSAIEMMLLRSTETDAYHADQRLEKWLAEIQSTLPPGVSLEKVFDVWDLLGAQLGMIVTNGFSGLVLVILTLFMFLNGRVGWWVMVGIPVSFLMGLALFHLIFGHGISIIALIGLIMALGIVVDDAIVVGEDAATHFEQGMPPMDAAVAGARRMWVPVVTSSMTTMAAFIPLLLIGGPMGDIILVLPTVLLCIIVASLVECFLVLPGHLHHSLAKAKPPAPGGWRRRFDDAFFGFRDARFMPFAKKALDYPGATICAAVGGVIIALSLVVSQHVGFAMVTGFDIEGIQANVQFSDAATRDDKDAFLKHLESTMDEVDAAVDNTNLLGWTSKYNLAMFNADRMTGEQYGSVVASYAYEESRTLAPQEFVNRWRDRIVKPAYVEQLIVTVNGGQNNGQPDITLVLSGEDLDTLKQGAEELALVLAAYPGVSNVIDNLPYGREQIIFQITPRGRSLGLTSSAIGSQLRAAYAGSRVQIFNEHDSELEVRVMLPDLERNDLGRLQQFPIRTPTGTFVPLSSVTTLYNRRGIDIIRHHDGRMAVSVSADVDTELGNAMAIAADIEDTAMAPILDRYNLSFGLGGKSEHDQMLLGTMALGGTLTLILIYLILTWVFASYLWPLAIMTAIPFGFTGAVFGHWVTGWDIGAMSLLAFFSLTGIVVNDSIVLISFLKRDVEAGKPLRQSLEAAIRARFRAVILTSLTTIAGLLPLIFTTSSLSFYVAPIAITICFGLAFATALVLIVIPALIVMLEAMKQQANQLLLAGSRAFSPSNGNLS
ncbi:MAG: efflux RND transporter permease subunit [Gammaproteobacteria bacterium]|nr:efflux RND transporter permease subunit [Gammaproteobacteria bacterium]